jgi:hypothetical protein
VYPFDDDAIEALFIRSDGKPRDLLRKAHSLITEGSERNWDIISGDRATDLLDSFVDDEEDDYDNSGPGFGSIGRRNW